MDGWMGEGGLSDLVRAVDLSFVHDRLWRPRPVTEWPTTNYTLILLTGWTRRWSVRTLHPSRFRQLNPAARDDRRPALPRRPTDSSDTECIPPSVLRTTSEKLAIADLEMTNSIHT
jgi:hypothetical protein